MSTKKNLTVAALAALLAVPAFNGTNVGHALHMPSVMVHADGVTSDGQGHTNDVAGTPSDVARWDNTPGVDEDQDGNESAFNRALGGTINANFKTGAPVTVNRNGHSITVVPEDDVPGKVVSVDGHSVSSASQILSLLNDNQNGSTGENDINNTSTNGTESSRYASKNNLPQTNENNGASKAAVLGAATATASVGLAALSFAKKHRDMEAADLTDVISAADGKKRNKPSYSAKSSYDMIMSNTFANLSKSLKNL